MGRYASGDVVLAPVRIGGVGERKVRPGVIVAVMEDGDLLISPVSSRPSTDGISVTLSLDDFARGGLDIFTESYVLTVHTAAIRTADVVGKKGSLRPETLAAIRDAMSSMQEKRERRRR